MRNNFITTLTELAKKDQDIILLTGDLGYGIFEDFEAKFPKQFFNVGVAEQNMTGLATGLALEGKKVVTYSIANFPTLRCLEQIRNDASYHNANITIVGMGGGFSYGQLGMSHHATEDLSILRSLPNISIVAPCTTREAGEAIKEMINTEGVGYLRLDKTSADDSLIESKFIVGKSRKYYEGKDITLIATGGILKEVNLANIELKKIGITSRIIGMHSVKPIDKEEIFDSALNTGGIVTIEENNIDGGFGSAISEICMDNSIYPKKFLRIGLNNVYSSIVGSQQYLRERYEMDSKAIFKKVSKLLSL